MIVNRASRRVGSPAGAVLGLVLGTLACHGAGVGIGSVPSRSVVLAPGDGRLIPLSFRDTSYELSVLIARPTGDTAEHERSRLGRFEFLLPGSSVQLGTRWQPPFTTVDSLIVSRRGLAPVSERLAAGGAVYVYSYQGDLITGSVQVGDSAPRHYVATFGERPFAFNEVEVLIRSVPLRAGATFVIPLFSEIDQAIEHDTIVVIGAEDSGASEGVRPWKVRFADPAIVTIYTVSPDSHRVLDAVTTQRKSGMRFHYAQPPAPSQHE